MSILTVSVIAALSACLGFFAAALLAGAKRSDRVPPREPAPDTRVLYDPSQN